MKRKELTGKKQFFLMIEPWTLLVMAFLVAYQSYYSHKEIRLLNTRCLEQGGRLVLETIFWTLGYSFPCDK